MYPFIDLGIYQQPTYGILLALAFLICYFRVWKTAPDFGLDKESIGNLFFWLLLGGFLGARVLYIVVEWKDFLANPWEMILSRTNFVFSWGTSGGLYFGDNLC